MNWISLKDQIPKWGNTVLVCQKNKNMFAAVAMYNGNLKMYGTMEDMPEQNPVTHWMPLPKPPKNKL